LAALARSLLDRFVVFGLRMQLPGDPLPDFRRFVALKHFEGDAFVVALAPITHIAPYLNDPDLKAGCVFYKAGAVPGFTRDVIVEPRTSHRHAIPYKMIESAEQGGHFRNFGLLPDDFVLRFKDAISKNVTLNKREKDSWRLLVD
jgi:hypothetical protein